MKSKLFPRKDGLIRGRVELLEARFCMSADILSDMLPLDGFDSTKSGLYSQPVNVDVSVVPPTSIDLTDLTELLNGTDDDDNSIEDPVAQDPSDPAASPLPPTQEPSGGDPSSSNPGSTSTDPSNTAHPSGPGVVPEPNAPTPPSEVNPPIDFNPPSSSSPLDPSGSSGRVVDTGPGVDSQPLEPSLNPPSSSSVRPMVAQVRTLTMTATIEADRREWVSKTAISLQDVAGFLSSTSTDSIAPIASSEPSTAARSLAEFRQTIRQVETIPTTVSITVLSRSSQAGPASKSSTLSVQPSRLARPRIATVEEMLPEWSLNAKSFEPSDNIPKKQRTPVAAPRQSARATERQPEVTDTSSNMDVARPESSSLESHTSRRKLNVLFSSLIACMIGVPRALLNDEEEKELPQMRRS